RVSARARQPPPGPRPDRPGPRRHWRAAPEASRVRRRAWPARPTAGGRACARPRWRRCPSWPARSPAPWRVRPPRTARGRRPAHPCAAGARHRRPRPGPASSTGARWPARAVPRPRRCRCFRQRPARAPARAGIRVVAWNRAPSGAVQDSLPAGGRMCAAPPRPEPRMYSRNSEPVRLERDCDAVLVPQGDAVTLPAGSVGYITQALGGSFTVFVEGNLFRIAGRDADAIGKEPPEPLELPEGADDSAVERLVWQQLRTCFDPEIPINIVDLGLVYEATVQRRDDGQRLVEV